jgi:hypothetical protein
MPRVESHKTKRHENIRRQINKNKIQKKVPILSYLRFISFIGKLQLISLQGQLFAVILIACDVAQQDESR